MLCLWIVFEQKRELITIYYLNGVCVFLLAAASRLALAVLLTSRVIEADHACWSMRPTTRQHPFRRPSIDNHERPPIWGLGTSFVLDTALTQQSGHLIRGEVIVDVCVSINI
jgi:hypothetical protein